MRISVIKHVPFEGPAAIGDWAAERGHLLAITEAWHHELPALDDFECLVVMGGPMNIYQFDRHPWLRDETKLISDTIGANKLVLGVCLGAQLIAAAAGAKVTRNNQPEIGWFPVKLTVEASRFGVLEGFPVEFTPLHWHGDTFALPPSAIHLASSEACSNQAFSLSGGRVVALQFHLEETRESLQGLIDHAADELEQPGDWIQSADALMATSGRFEEARDLLFGLLDRMSERADLTDWAPPRSGPPAAI